MDPLTALGLVSNVVSLVDFSGKLILLSRKALRAANGNCQEIQDLEVLATGIQDSLDRLAFHQGHLSNRSSFSTIINENERQLRASSDRCRQLAQDLLQRVAKFKATDGMSGYEKAKVMYHVGKDWFGSDTDEMSKRLDSCRDELQFHIVNSIRYELSKYVNSADDLQRRLNSSERAVLDTLQTGRVQLDGLSKSIEESRGSVVSAISVEGAQTRALIESRRSSSLLLKQHNQLDEFLSYFRLPGAGARQQSIEDAHTDTFEWLIDCPVQWQMYGDSGASCHPSNERPCFTEWLYGCGDYDTFTTFWIAGIPGAGKSTIMKMAHDHSTTRRVLQARAGARSVHTAIGSHFFWHQGVEVRNSIGEMLCSIISDVIHEIEKIDLCKILEDWLPTEKHRTRSRKAWSNKELLQLFRTIVSNKIFPMAVCIFVDGLDECADDLDELVGVIKFLTTVPHADVRCVLASRLWSVFTEAFGPEPGSPTVYLHKYTAPDILGYTTDRFSSMKSLATISKEQPQAAKSLINLIAQEAREVFRWVTVITKQLKKTLRNGGAFRTLSQEVERMPRELGELYNSILDRMDPDCTFQSALCLLLYREFSTDSREFSIPSQMLLHRGYCPFSTTFQSLTSIELSSDYNRTAGPQSATDNLERILESCTGGLLQINDGGKAHAAKPSIYTKGRRIDSLHKTVDEWLQKTATKTRLTLWLEMELSDLREEMFKGAISADIKNFPFHDHRYAFDRLCTFGRIDSKHIGALTQMLAQQHRTWYDLGIVYLPSDSLYLVDAYFLQQLCAPLPTLLLGHIMYLHAWRQISQLVACLQASDHFKTVVLCLLAIPLTRVVVDRRPTVGRWYVIREFPKLGADICMTAPGSTMTPWQLWLLRLVRLERALELDRHLAYRITRRLKSHGAPRVDKVFAALVAGSTILEMLAELDLYQHPRQMFPEEILWFLRQRWLMSRSEIQELRNDLRSQAETHNLAALRSRTGVTTSPTRLERSGSIEQTTSSNRNDGKHTRTESEWETDVEEEKITGYQQQTSLEASAIVKDGQEQKEAGKDVGGQPGRSAHPGALEVFVQPGTIKSVKSSQDKQRTAIVKLALMLVDWR